MNILHTLRVDKKTGAVLSVGGAYYVYPVWTPEMGKPPLNIQEYLIVKINKWPGMKPNGEYEINKKKVIMDLTTIKKIKATKDEGEIKKGDVLYLFGELKEIT